MVDSRRTRALKHGIDAGAARVHAVGYCIGGTALAMYMAWANRHYDADAVPVADCTFLTTLVDFRRPGDIEVFIDEGSVGYLCAQMQRTGFLDGKEMASAFRLLRSNSLIWHYVVHGWLYGETPPPFDVLYWNMDTTRMPQAMHAWYLRELYLHNRLIQPGALTVAGEALDLASIRSTFGSGAGERTSAPSSPLYHRAPISSSRRPLTCSAAAQGARAMGRTGRPVGQ